MQKQSESFKEMKANLSFTNDDILTYLKTNLIKDYTDSKMIMSLEK